MAFANITDWNQLLANKVVFITGAGGHIAKQLAKACYAQGARLILADLDSTLMREVINELTKKEEFNDDRILVVTLDVTDETTISAAVQTAINKWKTIDVLLNVAAQFQQGKFEELTLEEWTRVFQVNVSGYALMVKHIVPFFKKQNSGVIVNFASTMGVIALPNSGPYSASKAAVLQLTRNLAVDLGPFNIRVNSISPSLVNLPSIGEHAQRLGLTADMLRDVCITVSPIKRLVEAAEIANLVVFLASDLCPFMTGTNLVLDGGHTIS